ncbi:TRAP transporter small permease [Desulfonema magnum]|uniref:TRAP transporter small membrane protein, DctQ-like n=1 Tax=Desulfonema magnum TaxID=45655 RepID=A0A975GMV4_9BACT|nr:TRAP transporter small permease [Desulfonema magnum]QTA87117.1 TRAP transporter small membrane protein, DctQ-like [Desulfonema magnum]
MKRVSAILDHMENWGILICFSVSLISLTISITTRYVFHRPLTWPDELSTYLFMLMTFLGASASVKSNMELKVDAIYGFLPHWQFQLDILLHLIRFGVCISFIYSGWNFVLIERDMETVTPILLIPMSVIAAMFPFFGVIMGIRSVECLYQVIREHRQKGH